MLYPTIRPTLAHEFTFAGFSWPRLVATLPKGTLAQRLAARRQRPVTGPYCHAPRPTGTGRGFYLDDAGQPAPRWAWVDAGHRGWYCDDRGDQTICGIVLRLPHGRFLAGWAMGERMAAEVGATVYTDEDEAAHAADEEARIAADAQREWEAEEAAAEIEA